MSGIYGMVRYDGAPVTPETLGPMASAMSFWGPDGHGQWCGEAAGLGHLMLHVTPESLQERLPASIRTAPHLVITADARIDNRDELFDALGVSRPRRSQTPDSSLILLAYERWGAECVKRLLGDFAFAIWDARERKLFCARDPFGCVPLVYHHDGRRFIFASDVKGVLARVESPRLNEPLLAAYLQLHTYHAEKRYTFFEEVVKLEPAHTLTVTAAGIQLDRYWLPENAPEVRLRTDADYAEQMRALFTQAVECRLRSAFPIGAHLSGGLDSSSVSVVAARALRSRGEKLSVFSWSPPPESLRPYDRDTEYGRIEEVCRQENLSCQYVPLTAAGVIASFQRDFTIEPVEMMAREASVQVQAKARDLRVMLSGWGGDEVATTHTTDYLAEFFVNNQKSELLRAIRLRLLADDGPGSLQRYLLNARRLGAALWDIVVPCLPDGLYEYTAPRMYTEHRSPCIQMEFRRRHRQEVARLRGPGWRRFPNVRHTLSHGLEGGSLQRRIEHWRASGARHSMVYRYPMLDKRLVEFVVGVPATQFCIGSLKRSLFRRAADEIMPNIADHKRLKNIEDITMAKVRRDSLEAFSAWSSHLRAESANSRAAQFVDLLAVERAVQSGLKAGVLAGMTGVREAFYCFAVKAIL